MSSGIRKKRKQMVSLWEYQFKDGLTNVVGVALKSAGSWNSAGTEEEEEAAAAVEEAVKLAQ